MADQDANGYNDEASDFKRKHNKSQQEQDVELEDDHESQQQSQKAQEYIKGMMTERQTLERKYPIADRLLEIGEFGWVGNDECGWVERKSIND